MSKSKKSKTTPRAASSSKVPRKRVNLPIDDLSHGPRLASVQRLRVESLKAGIEVIGLAHPVMVDECNNIIDGSHRVEAMRELGRSHIPALQFQTNGDRNVWHRIREEHRRAPKIHSSPLAATRMLGLMWDANSTRGVLRLRVDRKMLNHGITFSTDAAVEDLAGEVGLPAAASYECLYVARRLGLDVLKELTRHSVAHALDADDLSKMAVAPKQAYASITDRLSRKKVTKVSRLRKWINDLPIDEPHVARLRKEGLPSTPRALGRDPHA